MYDIGSNHTQIRLIDNVDRFSYETWPLQHFKVWQISQILTSMWYAFRRCKNEIGGTQNYRILKIKILINNNENKKLSCIRWVT